MILLRKKPKSPLRYPGGKRLAVDKITNFIPQDTQNLYSPFFGGGSIEIACANNGITVHGYDNFKPLVEFWQCIFEDRLELAEIVKQYHPITKTQFSELQKTYDQPQSKFERAAIYFVLNAASFGGTTLSGGMTVNHPRFTIKSIEKIKNFNVENITVEHADFTISIPKAKNKIMYLDPPYLINQDLYGDKGNLQNNFDHIGLAKILKSKDNWILSYNHCNEIHEMYKGYTFLYPEWEYSLSHNKDSKSKEVLIFSDGMAEKNHIL